MPGNKTPLPTPGALPASPAFKPGTLLRHYKGGRYRVVGLCRIEASGETGVLYVSLDGDMQVTWMRPLREFGDMVQAQGASVPRFVVTAEAALGGDTAPSDD